MRMIKITLLHQRDGFDGNDWVDGEVDFSEEYWLPVSDEEVMKAPHEIRAKVERYAGELFSQYMSFHDRQRNSAIYVSEVEKLLKRFNRIELNKTSLGDWESIIDGAISSLESLRKDMLS
jgi:hypothetical protein